MANTALGPKAAQRQMDIWLRSTYPQLMARDIQHKDIQNIKMDAYRKLLKAEKTPDSRQLSTPVLASTIRERIEQIANASLTQAAGTK